MTRLSPGIVTAATFSRNVDVTPWLTTAPNGTTTHRGVSVEYSGVGWMHRCIKNVDSIALKKKLNCRLA